MGELGMSTVHASVTIRPLYGKHFEIHFPYNKEILEKVRSLPGRKYNISGKYWIVPDTQKNRALILQNFPESINPPSDPSKTTIPENKDPLQTSSSSGEELHADNLKTSNFQSDIFCKTSYLKRVVEELQLRNYSIATKRNYTDILYEYLTWLGKKPTGEDQEAIRAYQLHLITDRKYSPRTVNLHISALNFLYGMIPGAENCIRSTPRMKEGKNLPKVYTLKEIEAILNVNTNEKHRMLLQLTYSAGLRISEIRNLLICDIEWDSRLIWLRHAKGNKDRSVTLSSSIQEPLKVYLARYKPLIYMFEGRIPGKKLTLRTISNIYDHSVEKAGVVRKGGIHTLRHSWATHHLEQGTNLRHIQVLMGHKSSKTTEIYTHVAKNTIADIRSPIDSITLREGCCKNYNSSIEPEKSTVRAKTADNKK